MIARQHNDFILNGWLQSVNGLRVENGTYHYSFIVAQEGILTKEDGTQEKEVNFFPCEYDSTREIDFHTGQEVEVLGRIQVRSHYRITVIARLVGVGGDTPRNPIVY